MTKHESPYPFVWQWPERVPVWRFAGPMVIECHGRPDAREVLEVPGADGVC